MEQRVDLFDWLAKQNIPISAPPIEGRALLMIEAAIDKMIRGGATIDRIKLNVSPASRIAKHRTITTRYGDLAVRSNGFVTKGVSYAIEDSGRGKIEFAWITKREAK